LIVRSGGAVNRGGVFTSRTMTVKLLVRTNALPLTTSVTVATTRFVLGPSASPVFHEIVAFVAPTSVKPKPGGKERSENCNGFTGTSGSCAEMTTFNVVASSKVWVSGTMRSGGTRDSLRV